MNAVIQSSAYPLVVLERNTLITQALLGRLSAYTGSISRVSDLHRGKIALSAQRLISVLFLAGKPLESRWADAAISSIPPIRSGTTPPSPIFFFRAPLRRRLFLIFQESY